MGNKELLELAAKAAGLEGYKYCESWDGMAKYIDTVEGYDHRTLWRPHKSNEDAFRLMIKLRMLVDVHTSRNIIDVVHEKSEIQETYIHNAELAARLAIIHCAAEIGERLP